jgi:hypothetical protein
MISYEWDLSPSYIKRASENLLSLARNAKVFEKFDRKHAFSSTFPSNRVPIHS